MELKNIVMYQQLTLSVPIPRLLCVIRAQNKYTSIVRIKSESVPSTSTKNITSNICTQCPVDLYSSTNLLITSNSVIGVIL